MDKHKRLLEACTNELYSCINYVQQYSNDKEQNLNILRNLAKDYSIEDINYSVAQKACDSTVKHFDNIENDCTEDIEQIYENYLNQLPKSTSHENHSIWRKTNNLISGNTSTTNENSSGSGDLEDDVCLDNTIDEGIIPSQFQPPVDPVTKKVIEKPCKNRKCGHIYEYSVIIGLLKSADKKRMKFRCPYIGCTNQDMRHSNLIKDDDLEELISTYHKNNTMSTDQPSFATYDLCDSLTTSIDN